MDSSVAIASAEKVAEGRERILAELRKVIVGQDEVVEQVLIALFTGGHCLITGVPGLAKTLLIKTLAGILDLDFKRIQFTPDLMPSDITGTEILDDEINRTPPKTQAALLEAMQEYHVTAAGRTYQLELPFFVLATQNPIELEGTYPLPEAQLDRFMFNSILDDLSAEDELKVIDLTTATRVPKVEAVTSAEELLDFQQLVRMVPIAETLSRYVVALVRATRPKSEKPHELVMRYVNYGASVRAAQFIVLAAKARALSNQRYHVSYEDITSVVVPVLRHRILLNFHAESDQVGADEILKQLVSPVERP